MPATQLRRPPSPPRKGFNHGLLDLVYVRDAESLTIRIETDRAPTHRVFEVQGPERLVIDMMGMESDSSSRRIEIGEAGIVRARLAQHQAEPERVVRVVVEMEMPLPHQLVIGARALSIVFQIR